MGEQGWGVGERRQKQTNQPVTFASRQRLWLTGAVEERPISSPGLLHGLAQQTVCWMWIDLNSKVILSEQVATFLELLLAQGLWRNMLRICLIGIIQYFRWISCQICQGE